MSKKNYFIYDDRANYDVKSARAIECFKAINDNEAAKYHARNYKGHDTVLCDSEDKIIY
jgi:hypothetical protein